MAELTPERLAELRGVAEMATPGPWEVYGPDYESDVMQHATGVCAEDEYGSEFDICRAPGERDEAAESADMEYIAALDPATVRALLDEIECLRAEIERLRRVRETAKEHLREAADYCAIGSPMLARSELAKALALLSGRDIT